MDAITLPAGATVTPLRQIAHPKGDVFHAMTSADPGYAGFGEAYFTHVLPGESKGWKQHTRMVLNLVVPCGAVRFHLLDEATGETGHVILGRAPGHYARLTVQPGTWVAFTGLGKETNMVLNLASLPHDPQEAVNRALDTWPLPGGTDAP